MEAIFGMFLVHFILLLYRQWTERGDYRANPASSQARFLHHCYPSPNVTGIPPLGHVLNNTLQDILARRARLQGMEVLWLPGTDHAGIATRVPWSNAPSRKREKSNTTTT
jgi:valyl-tRNA synthetase